MRYAFENSEALVEPGTVPKSLRSNAPKLSTDPSLNIYPNPSSDHLVLEFRNWGEQVSLKLVDGAGRLVRDEIISTGKTAYLLDVTELSEGSYTLMLASLDGNLTEQRQIEVIR